MNARRLRVQGARRSHPPTHIEQRETTGPSIRHGHNAGGRQQTDAPELSNVIHVVWEGLSLSPHPVALSAFRDPHRDWLRAAGPPPGE